MRLSTTVLCSIAVVTSVTPIAAFHFAAFHHGSSFTSTSPTAITTGRPVATELLAKRKKKSDLAWMVQQDDDDNVGMPRPSAEAARSSKAQSSSSSSSLKRRKQPASKKGPVVSEALAAWAASDDDDADSGDNSTTKTSTKDPALTATPTTGSADSFVAFEPESMPRRRVKQKERFEREKRLDLAVQEIVDELEETLEGSNNNLEDILSVVGKLVQQPSEGTALAMKNLITAKTQSSFRLAWVGSDDAICHVGTGLHKIPLARLQEVFLTFQGRSRFEMYEVISVIGPFPNVRNTLQGRSQLTGQNVWKITMDSMIDGTGKELLAGKEENLRKVDLQIVFCDKNAIVAAVPLEGGSPRVDPLEDKGQHLLVFVREDDLDYELERLRVL